MVVAREIGYSESEFWESDPIFFNEVAEVYYREKGRRLKGLGSVFGVKL